jgi:DNA primase catalytic core
MKLTTQQQKAYEIIETEYQQLRPDKTFRAGKNIFCPFHDDKGTPNLNYDSNKMVYHCFACGSGGGLIQFIMEAHNFDLSSAKKYLQQQYGFTMPTKKIKTVKTTPEKQQDSTLAKIIEIGHGILLKNKTVLNYLLTRGISQKTIKEQKFAYLGKTDSEVKLALKEFQETQLLDIGVINKKKDVASLNYGLFADQVIVPLYHNGHIIDIQGRSISNKRFSKRANIVQNQISGNKVDSTNEYTILAEGLFDYATLVELGLNSKLCGLQRNDDSLKSLSAYKIIYICFDNDTVGNNGAIKIARQVLETLKKDMSEVRIITIPKEDEEKADINDSFLQNQSKFRGTFFELMQTSSDLIEYQLNSANADQYKIAQDIISFVQSDKITVYKKELCNKFNIKMDAVDQLFISAKSDLQINSKDGIFAGLTFDEHKKLNPAQDFVDGKFNFCFTNIAKKRLYIIQSGATHFLSTEAFDKGYMIKHNWIEDNMIKQPYISEYLSGVPIEINIRQLFKDIHDYLTKYLYFKNTDDAILSSLWVILTYLYMGFESVPYLWVNATKGSGKSTFMDVLSKICFNSLTLDASSTTAVIFRGIDELSPTLFVDEFENMSTEVSSTLKAIFNSGYKKGAFTLRMEKIGKDKLVRGKFYTFGPKVFLGIDPIHETLYDRCIKIEMKRSPQQMKKFIFDEEAVSRTDNIKKRLILNTLLHGADYVRLYRKGDLNLPSFLANRERELWEPLYCIATMIEQNQDTTPIMETLDRLSSKSLKSKREDVALCNVESNIVILLSQLIKSNTENMQLENGAQWYKFSTIYHFNQIKGFLDSEFSADISSKSFGQILKNRLHLEPRTIGNDRGYIISQDIIEELGSLYDIPHELLTWENYIIRNRYGKS